MAQGTKVDMPTLKTPCFRTRSTALSLSADAAGVGGAIVARTNKRMKNIVVKKGVTLMNGLICCAPLFEVFIYFSFYIFQFL
jgi:hypothetical protein